jgi:tRNA (guanine26-N2/guanine27-N2)-dimethyltransferase
MGPLHDSTVVREMSPSKWTNPQSARLLSTIQGEADLPPFFVTTDEIAALENGSPPRLAVFLEGLRERGYRAARTHFHPRGVRTDAPFDDVRSVFRDCAPIGSTDGSRPAR